MLTCESQNKTFFEQLQTTKGIDLRDKRGLKHEMALVLVGVTLSLLCNRDGSLSSIHRHMNNTFEILRTKLNLPNIVVISRSQLPQVLMRVNLSLFEALLFKNYGVVLSEDEKKWFSIDGKELRGSIEKGNKRGEAIVLAVSHQNRVIQAQGYYSGDKESEIPTVRTVLKENKLDNQKISMDAIHCNPETLSQINQKKGIYLVGLKGNQGELLQDCTDFVRFNKADFTLLQEEIIKPKHGRQEIREYQVFDISKEERDKRWAKSQISTLIEVKRDFLEVKSKKKSTETSYYISNQGDYYVELCHGVRGHWSVETNNYVRDVTFSEDDFKSKKRSLARSVSATRTLANTLINSYDCINKKAQIENFADNFKGLLEWLTKINFL